MEHNIDKLNSLFNIAIQQWPKDKENSPALHQLAKHLKSSEFSAILLENLLIEEEKYFSAESSKAKALYAKIHQLNKKKTELIIDASYETAAKYRDMVTTFYTEIGAEICESLRLKPGFNFYKSILLLIKPNDANVDEMIFSLQKHGYLGEKMQTEFNN